MSRPKERGTDMPSPCPNTVQPGWPGRPRPPGVPRSHRTRRLPVATGSRLNGKRSGNATFLLDDRVHPGWPGRPRPPGIPRSHYAGRVAAITTPGPSGEEGPVKATLLPDDRMHPVRPGRPRPPGIPRSHLARRAADATGAGPSGQRVVWEGRPLAWRRSEPRKARIAPAPKGPRAPPRGKCLQGPCVTAQGCPPREPRGWGED